MSATQTTSFAARRRAILGRKLGSRMPDVTMIATDDAEVARNIAPATPLRSDRVSAYNAIARPTARVVRAETKEL